MAYRKTAQGDVEITISQADFDFLLMCLGVATVRFAPKYVLGLANRINEGNRAWTQYDLREAATDGIAEQIVERAGR